MTDLEIAEKIRSEKLSPLAAVGALPDKLSPVIAASILEQASGDQAIVLTEMLEKQGLLKDNEVKKVYAVKVKTAKNALDRVERIKAKMDSEVDAVLRTAKADSRKNDMGDMGKVFLHIDISGSMDNAIQLAIDKGAIIAECVQNPEENFHWGLFNGNGYLLKKPEKFEKDAFAAVLYGVRAGGTTNCLALYSKARELGCDTDIYITDQEHTDGSIRIMVEQYRRKGIPDPKQVVIVDVLQRHSRYYLKNEFEALGIPVAVIDPSKLSESALVTQSIKMAMKGATAIIDEIMNTELLALPKWWASVPV